MPTKLLLILSLLTLAITGCGTPSAAGPADTFGLDFSLPEGSTTSGAMVFLVDGVNSETFAQMLQAGELPAFKRYFVDRGLYVTHAMASIPSVTIANLTSIATGCFPGNTNIMGVNWFERNRLIWRNYETIAQKNTVDGDYQAATIFEHFPEQLTFSLFFQPHRGATKFYENWTSAGPPFYFGWFEFVDRLTLHRLKEAMDIARQYRQFPSVTVCYLLAPDFRGYRHGLESQEYRDSLRHSDYQIGRVLGDMERAGLLDKVHIAIVSDHSMAQVDKHWVLEDYLRKELDLNIATSRLWENVSFEKRLKEYSKYYVVPYGSGDRYMALCLRKPVQRGTDCQGMHDWLTRPDVEDLHQYPANGKVLDLPATLAARPEVDAVAYMAGSKQVRVQNALGIVEFEQRPGPDEHVVYRVIAGEDPLGYAKVGIASGTMLAGRQWLVATAVTSYPDLPSQIVAYFNSHRAGDIAVFAAPGYDLKDVHSGGHGGLRPEDNFTPMLIAGPGVPMMRMKYARTVDLMPTILKLQGKPVPAGIDGQVLKPLTSSGD